jgi:hypothetical protein
LLKGGTSHLLRHVKSCLCKRQAATSSNQTSLHFARDGHVAHFEYMPAVARTELCRLLARLDLSLGLGASLEFEEYIRTAHNPRFKYVSRTTTTYDIDAYFLGKVDEVKSLLSEASCICLTSDIWSGNAKEDYISVVVHFVTTDWELEKRIIVFRLIDCSHSRVNIAEKISLVRAEYDLTSKVLSITLNNASTMDHLTPSLSSYIGSTLLHQSCACHIINLIVKSGLKCLKLYLEDFKTAISVLSSSNQRIASFISFCLTTGVRPCKFGLDMDVRWNSTYLMFKHLLPYKDIFSVFIHTNYRSGTLLTPDHWYVAKHILQFLEQFYLSTVSLSDNYYPSALFMMHVIIEIFDHLNQFENDNLLRDAIVPMKSKFLKYWLNIPLLYSFAFILDPRSKLISFNSALQVLSELLNHDYSTYYNEVRTELANLFAKYDSKFGSLRLQRPSQPSATLGKQPCS